MKTLVLTALLFFSITSLTTAQVKFGVLGGANTFQVDKTASLILQGDTQSEDLQVSIEELKFGFHFGIFLLAKSDFLYFKPHVQFNSQGVDYHINTVSDSIGSVLSEKYNSLDIPIQFGFAMGPVRVGIGPVGHVIINTSSEIEEEYTDYHVRFSKVQFGYIGGIGLDIQNFHLDVSYEGNLSKWGSHIVYNDKEYEFSKAPARIIGTIGISF